MNNDTASHTPTPWMALASRVNDYGEVYVEFSRTSEPELVATFNSSGTHQDRLQAADHIVNSSFEARKVSSLKAEVEKLRAAAKELLEASYNPLESKSSIQRLYDARAEVISLVSESTTQN